VRPCEAKVGIAADYF